MSRISEKFSALRKEGRIAFMPFLVAGDPDFKTGLEIVKETVRRADLLEIGFPYSDPLADGPTIQAADSRALAAGMTTDRVFESIAAIQKFCSIPISVLVYANLVYQYGIERFYRAAKTAGVDGVLIPDVPIEESSPFVASALKAGIDPIFLMTQMTTPLRLKKILRLARGYLYVVSVLGVTGVRNRIDAETPRIIKRLKSSTDLPLAVGFGISQKEHIRALQKSGADGAIVGSSLIRIIEKNTHNKKKLLRQLGIYLDDLAAV